MDIVLIILAVLVCILLGAFVLIQNPKGGGLTSNFSSSSQLMGVQKTTDFLGKGTLVLAGILMVLSLSLNVVLKGGPTTGKGLSKSEQKTIDEASKPSAAPATTGGKSLTLPAAGAKPTK